MITQAPFQKIKPHLQNLEQSGDGWTARCPAHEDNRNSLSLSEKEDGTLLLKCHAGCSTEAVVHECGLTMRELFPKQERPVRQSYVKRSHVYRNRTGEVTHRKDIFLSGGASWYHHTGEQWEKKQGNRKPEIYRADEVASQPDAEVWLCEGEKDADTLSGLGLVATSLPSTGTFKREYKPFFEGRKVFICEDHDKAGRNHGEKCGKALQGVAKSVEVIRFPELPEKGDVTDFIEAGGTVEQLRQRAQPWEQAQEPELPTFADSQGGPDHFTDCRNAEVFIQQHGENLRYCFPWKSWLIWNGQRWEPDRTSQILRRAKSVYEFWMEQIADMHPDDAKDAIKHAQKSASTRGMEQF